MSTDRVTVSTEADRSPQQLLASFPKLQAGISAIIAGLLPMLLPERLVPYQLSALRPGATILVVAGFLIGWAYQRQLRRAVGRIVIMAAVGAVLLVAMQTTVVETIQDIGDPPETRHYLVGFAATPIADSLYAQIGTDLSLPDRLRRIGPDRIPQLYGASYSAARILYTLGALLFVTGAVVALTVADLPLGARHP